MNNVTEGIKITEKTKFTQYQNNGILFSECFNGTLKGVKNAITNGASISMTYGGDFPLHIAAYRGHNEIVNFLLNKGANVNSISKIEKETALHRAVIRKNLEVVKTLLDKNAYVNVKNKNGHTPLHLAAKGAQSIRSIKIMINMSDTAMNRKELMVEENNLKIIELLLSKRADPFILNKNGKKPINLAKYKNVKDILLKAEKDMCVERSKCMMKILKSKYDSLSIFIIFNIFNIYIEKFLEKKDLLEIMKEFKN